MGRKSKLKRFAENKTFDHVVEAPVKELLENDFHLKGKWSEAFFGNQQPLILELACGKGEYTVGLARMFPCKNFLGLDIKGARLWRGAKTIEEENIPNAGFIRTRIDLIERLFAENEINEIWITFPDPQPKKQRKRLTSPMFLRRYAALLQPGGCIHLKTDNQMLHEYTSELIKTNDLPLFIKTNDLYNSEYVTDILNIKTFYEQSFLEEGKRITYLKFGLGKATSFTDVELEF